MRSGPLPILSVIDGIVVGHNIPNHSRPSRLADWLHHYSLGVFALLFLLLGISGLFVGKNYWDSQHPAVIFDHSTTIKSTRRPLQGPNIVVPSKELTKSVQQITHQPITLNVAGKSLPVSATAIKSWLQIVADKQQGVTYIHVNQNLIGKSLSDAAASAIKAPVNQVSVAHADGSTFVISKGHDGVKLGDTAAAAAQIEQNLLGAKGFLLDIPTETQAFATSTAADFDKLIEVDVVTKQMYLYQKGELYKNYPISAGAAATPTPIGQYKIYQKLTIQDMRGFNVDGTRYLQPNVRWVNYFKQGGYAIHGNYWRPTSWFGVINSSHGCVSLPEDQAKDVYDWAPIGTTVITHY